MHAAFPRLTFVCPFTMCRSVQLLERTVWSYVAIPVIYLAMMLIRTGCTALFNPLFSVLGEPLSWQEILFVGWAGLRGSVSLIMVSAFVAGSSFVFAGGARETDVVHADISLWTSAFVLLTLVINGPLIGLVACVVLLYCVSFMSAHLDSI
jgi:NhaP-type Na+/H+ or K+/H+ antiporter